MAYEVERGWTFKNPDMLHIYKDGELVFETPMQPDACLLEIGSVEERRDRAWFFTGSKFGAEILQLPRRKPAS